MSSVQFLASKSWALVLALMVAAVLSWAVPTRAAPLSWNNAAGGAAGTNTNWTPNAIPGGADDLTFNLNAAYSVTFGATVTASRTHTYRLGTVTLTMSSPHAASTGLTVGDLNLDNATMTLTTGTFTSNASAVVGDAAGSIGTLNVNDSDADFVVAGATSDLTIGNSGDANMNITGRGHVEVGDQFIAGASASSSPTILISGALATPPFGVSLLDVLGTGQSRIGAGGDVNMTISNGGVADFAGDLVIANGSASNSSVTVQTAVLLNARLQVAGDLLVGRNISGGIAAGTATININTGGTTSVDGDTFLGDPDGGTGTINLGGGTFTGALPVNMETGSTITGFGTVNADVTVGPGSIVPTTAAGITMNGFINNTGANVVGTKIHFGATGGYVGSGTCQADITGDPASSITATGTLSIGSNTTSGFFYLGTLNVGGSIVTILDSNGAVFGGLTTINSGRIECANGIGVQNGATLKGDGLLVSDLTVSGVLDPHTGGALGGLITVQGDLLMNTTDTGIMDMEIGGSPGGSNNDRVNVSGTATFNGTMRVKLKNGYIPHVGEQFIAINATAGRIGTFDTIVPPAPTPCNNVTFVLVYSSTAAIVLVRPPLGCTALGDLNSNGGCEGQDIQLFIESLIAGPYNACADMNGDCANTPADIPIFLNCLL